MLLTRANNGRKIKVYRILMKLAYYWRGVSYTHPLGSLLQHTFVRDANETTDERNPVIDASFEWLTWPSYISEVRLSSRSIVAFRYRDLP